jgi:hypothetical protein
MVSYVPVIVFLNKLERNLSLAAAAHVVSLAMSTQTFARATQFFAMATLDHIVATRMKYLQNF